MSSAKQNQSIARLIVGAMSIDGTLDSSEREKVAAALVNIGMEELVADVGSALEQDDGSFNLYAECKNLVESLGAAAPEVAPLVFRVVTEVVAYDRFVSSREASYLSGMAKRLDLPMPQAQTIFKQAMAGHRARLEIGANSVDPDLHPHLRELLSFPGSESLVGPAPEGSIEQLIATPGEEVLLSQDDLYRALTILGLERTNSLEDAEVVWKETINNLDLPKMAALGETFVSAAINRITRVNEAYKTILKFHRQTRAKKGS